MALTAQGEPAPKADAEQAGAEEEVQMIDPFAYTYSPFGKRDPFEPFERKKFEAPKSLNPLLNYDLSKFKLTGIVWGLANPKAIVQDGEGKGHIIRRGTRIGRNRGKVMRILRDKVVVSEQFRDPLGKLIVSEHSMNLVTEEDQKRGK